MFQDAFSLFPSCSSHTIPSSRTLPFCLSLPFTSPFPFQQSQWQLNQPIKKQQQFSGLCGSYEVGGDYLDEELFQHGRHRAEEEWNDKLDTSHYEALLKGGEQVTSVLLEMITLLEDMEMDEASEKVAVELAAQGVIGKRVDEMEAGFMMALDYMIQLAEKNQDEKRKSLLEVIKETLLSHLTKKCPPHVQLIGLLCRTPRKESRNELLRRVAAGGGAFESKNGTKVLIPGAKSKCYSKPGR